ncbi:MAG: hypothetical protein M0Q90_02285 [Bacteroidales bacterium]|nr:hypothetical protein [Bacteroidales bacterium]
MKNSIITFVLLLFSSYLCRHYTKEPIKSASIPITIKWVDQLSGDFSFANNWSYPEAVYKNEYGQLSCDGLCPPEIEAMKDSTGRIYADSLQAFYKIIDTTHQMHSIQCEAWCYEWAGTDFIEVFRQNKDSVSCFTIANIATHCSLHLDIIMNTCYAFIDLKSLDQSSDTKYYCTNGYIIIDKNSWEKGLMKAEFSFNFDNHENPEKPIYWKAKIFAKIITA